MNLPETVFPKNLKITSSLWVTSIAPSVLLSRDVRSFVFSPKERTQFHRLRNDFDNRSHYDITDAISQQRRLAAQFGDTVAQGYACQLLTQGSPTDGKWLDLTNLTTNEYCTVRDILRSHVDLTYRCSYGFVLKSTSDMTFGEALQVCFMIRQFKRGMGSSFDLPERRCDAFSEADRRLMRRLKTAIPGRSMEEIAYAVQNQRDVEAKYGSCRNHAARLLYVGHEPFIACSHEEYQVLLDILRLYVRTLYFSQVDLIKSIRTWGLEELIEACVLLKDNWKNA